MSKIKPVKVTAEFTLSLEDFEKWCRDDIKPSERMFEIFVEKNLWSKLGMARDEDLFDDIISKPIEFNGMSVRVEYV